MYTRKRNKRNKISPAMIIFLSLILVFGLSGCSRSNKKADIAQLFNKNDTLNADSGDESTTDVSEDESRTEASDETEDESSTDVSDKAEAENKTDVSGEAGNEGKNDYQSLTGRRGLPSPNVGLIKDNSYTSLILGLGCTFDENWNFYTYDDANIYELAAKSVDGLCDVNIMVEVGFSSPKIDQEYIDYIEQSLSSIGAVNIESEIISLDFVDKNCTAIHSTAEIDSIPYYQCQVIYRKTSGDIEIGNIAIITATSFLVDETTNILDMFHSVDIEDMRIQKNNSDKKDTVSTDAETGKNIYEISALQATVSLPEKYHVYSRDIPFTEEMCQSQGLTVEQMTQYMDLASVDMMAVPADEKLSGCSFGIDVRINSDKDLGADNFKYLSAEKFELYAAMTINSFGASDYQVLETDQAKYIVFDCKLSSYGERCEERIYTTIINEGMIIFIGYTGEGLNMTEENYQDLEDFAASLKLNAGSNN